jgi:hypothetical protein
MKQERTNGNLLMFAGTGAGTQEVVEGEILSLEYLQSIYRNPMEPTSMRMRAAIECLPFENPKMAVTAIATMNGKSFAEALDRCIARSRSPHVVNVPALPTVDAEELKRPMPYYRNNYRRY